MSLLNDANVKETIKVVEEHIVYLVENETFNNKNLNMMLRGLKAGGRLDDFKVVNTKKKGVTVKDIYLKFPQKIDYIQINIEVSSN